MPKLFNSQNFNWHQMDLLNESAREEVRTEKIEALVSELIRADKAAVNQVIKAHRLNDREIELLMEILAVNYILN